MTPEGFPNVSCLKNVCTANNSLDIIATEYIEIYSCFQSNQTIQIFNKIKNI